MKPIGLSVAFALLCLVGCELVVVPVKTEQTEVLAPILRPPAWLWGQWSATDETLRTETFTFAESSVEWERESPALSVASGSYFHVSLSRWYTDQGVALKPRWNSADAYAIDLEKDGRDFGSLRFELNDGTLTYTERLAETERKVVLTRLTPAPSSSPSPSPSPMPRMGPGKFETPFFACQLDAGWSELPIGTGDRQWEPIANLNRKVVGLVMAEATFERTAAEGDLEAIKNAWVADAGPDGSEVEAIQLFDAPAYLVSRMLPAQEGTARRSRRRYLVPRHGRIYAFELAYTNNQLFVESIVKEFDQMVRSVIWPLPSP